MADLHVKARRAHRTFLRHRRLVAATLAAASVLAITHILAPPPRPEHDVVVAARDLRGGIVIRPDDVRVVGLPSEAAPKGGWASTERVLGQTLAGPMRAGEPVTDRRVVGEPLLAGYPDGLVAAPVRIADPAAVRLLRVGDNIDVYASGADADATADRVVEWSPVVAVPASDDTTREGALVLLAVTTDEAARLAQASAVSTLSISLRR